VFYSQTTAIHIQLSGFSDTVHTLEPVHCLPRVTPAPDRQTSPYAGIQSQWE